MKKLFLVLIIISLLFLPGCHQRSTNVARCDVNLDPQASSIERMGAWMRCDPSYDPDEQSHCPPTYKCDHVVQWNRFRSDGAREPQGWEWEKNLDARQLQFYGWMLEFEIGAWTQGRIPDYYLNTQKAGVPPDVYQDAFNYALSKT